MKQAPTTACTWAAKCMMVSISSVCSTWLMRSALWMSALMNCAFECRKLSVERQLPHAGMQPAKRLCDCVA